jgi:O-acetyl-ADP-ribose deacetylase (regulator of RNase III)
MRRLEVIKGDITTQQVDVIVNAAHEGLTGGGGVDGAIHLAAGPLMTGECMNLPVNDRGIRCPVGRCRMTCGYMLPALYILHTVGPVWRGGSHNELVDLESCYLNCLCMAESQGLRSIAFPCISTGAFAMPKTMAAEKASWQLKNWLSNPIYRDSTIKLIRVVCFDEENYQEYLKKIPNGSMEWNNE